MKKTFVSFVALTTCLSLFAFSPIQNEAAFNNLSNSRKKLVKEVSSFTEMYTRTYLSDQTVWAHQHKEYNVTSTTTGVDMIESTLNRN